MITLTRLSKRFAAGRESVLAMDDITLEVPGHRFFTLLGPSGCGKSTLLRCVAGLETPNEGEIGIGGVTVFSSAAGVNVPPNRRRIGMVFQSYAIWPHMTVFANVAFPVEVRGLGDVRRRTMEALALVGLDALADRYASRLSGGQQQRIAFARAVVAEPDVLLLDEPLSNLDAALREQMRGELRNLQQRLKVTTLYVTHDQAEALSMSDTIAVMRDGRLVEVASPEALYYRPRTEFTAQFIGGANILEGTVAEAGTDGGTAVAMRLGTLHTAEAAPAGPVKLFIRPENVAVLAPGAAVDGPNVFAATVVSDRFLGDAREIDLALGGAAVPLRCKAPAEARVTGGGMLRVRIDPAHVHVLKAG